MLRGTEETSDHAYYKSTGLKTHFSELVGFVTSPNQNMNSNSPVAEITAPFFPHTHPLETNGQVSLARVNVGLLQASVSASETVKHRMCLQSYSLHTLALC